MTRHRAAASVLVLCLGGAATAVAQTAKPWSVQVSGLYATISARVFETVENGPGAEAQLRFTRSALSIGAGGQLTRHGIASDVVGDMNLYGVFVEPRYVVAIASDRLAPYVSARMSYLRGELDGDQGSVEGNGAQFNAGGGVLMRLTRRANLDVGATYGRLDFGRITKVVDGEQFEDEGQGGGNLVVRIGLAFGLGR